MTQMMNGSSCGKAHGARHRLFRRADPVRTDPRPGKRLLAPFCNLLPGAGSFWSNLPVGALAVVLAVLFLPKDHEELRPRDLDLVGLDAAVAGAGALSVRLGSSGRAFRLGSLTRIPCFAGGVFL